MDNLKMRIIAATALNCCMLLTGALASLDAANQTPGPIAGRSWSLPLPSNSSLDLVWIPAGTFLLGSPATEPGRSVDEGPQTQVKLTKGFWLGKTFATIGQWKTIMGVSVREQLIKRIEDETPHEIGGKKQTLREFMNWSRDTDPANYLGNEDDSLPMYFVNWNDAKEFCQRLNARERTARRLPAGYAYDLPTEAQWEYACRAGTSTATYAGPSNEQVLDKIAWYGKNSDQGYAGRCLGPTRSGPRKVGQKEPNVWGLYDMYGNIWQWCRDWYGPYPGGSVIDPAGPASGTARVNRGGSFGSGANSERSACRAANPPPEASAYRGFRIALAPLPP